jgi:hypothetical protein
MVVARSALSLRASAARCLVARPSPRRLASTHAATADDEHFPPEGDCHSRSHPVDANANPYPIWAFADFSAPIWKTTLVVSLIAFGLYRLSLASGPSSDSSPAPKHPSEGGYPVEAYDESKPFLTRYIAYHMPRDGLWKERAYKNLELAVKAAEDKILVQSAEAPPIRRIRDAGCVLPNSLLLS